MADSSIQLTGAARSLVLSNLLSSEDASRALEQANHQRIPFVSYLVGEAMLTAREIALCLSNDFDIPLLDLTTFDQELFPKKSYLKK